LLCDGIFGPKTKKGVQDYQRAEGLRDKSGIVGAETWESMDSFSLDYEGVTEEELKSE
jgi:peptidoglycan hydrolase-like protein with peptidoglycan-binding domain